MPFTITRLGVLMEPDPGDPLQKLGVLNPAGARGPDGEFYLFPRVVAQGNISRIGRARVRFGAHAEPEGTEWLGYALEPREPYETSDGKGGVEDPRVTYVAPLGMYVMAYTAYTAHHARVALAVSPDLRTWDRLGLLHFAHGADEEADLNDHANKDALVFPDVVAGPDGRPSIAVLHRPTLPRSLQRDAHLPAGSAAHPMETIWISYAPLDAARSDIRGLTRLRGHRILMRRREHWEQLKIGAGAPPLRLPYGWLLLYHGVSTRHTPGGVQRRYCMGAAILDLADPTQIRYRSRRPIMTPDEPYEQQGHTLGVVFPTAADRRADGAIDVYYGAADTRVAVARLAPPERLPAQE